MSCIITYQKQNGDIFFRPYKSDYGKKVGDETSMGWKIMEIHYKYGDNYYCYNDFIRMIRKNKQTIKQKMANYICKKLYKYR